MNMNDDGSIKESFCQIKKERFVETLVNLYSLLEDGVDISAMFRQQPNLDYAKEMMV